ncbi:MAG: outer membrane beta-barrel protein, partial [Thermoguttaceae bacterium]
GQWYWDGWLSAGATISGRDASGGANGQKPWGKTSVISRFPDRYDEFLLNQLYFTAGRAVNKGGCNFDIGGRVDLLYGADYFYTTSLGFETSTKSYMDNVSTVYNPREAEQKWNSYTKDANGNPTGARNLGYANLYGLSMPQLYAELYAPLGLGTTVKAGHFYSMMGFESAMSPENFFYSHTYTMVYGEPITMTGAVVSQQLTNNLTGIFGVTNGWDAWENPCDQVSFVAGGKWTSWNQATAVAFTINTGAATEREDKTNNRTNYSLVVSQQLSNRLKWVIQHDLGVEENAMRVFDDPTRNFENGQWATLTNYLFYSLTDKLSVGARFEWFQDMNNTRILNAFRSDNYNVTGNNYYDITLGLNWKPTQFITFRPEVRWDWSDVEILAANKVSKPFGPDFGHANQIIVGLEGIIRF